MSHEDQTKILLIGDKPKVAARIETESHSIKVYASPSIRGRPPQVGDLNRIIDDPLRHLPKLDGEFFTVIETPAKIFVANDRFASKPLFYLFDGNQLVVSLSYSHLWKWLSNKKRLKPDPLAFYEFLHFQRLFAETTFDQASKALPPASLITFNTSNKTISVNQYWTPNFKKTVGRKEAIARDLADAVRSSVTTKTRQMENPSLLLSGGMDSRVVLGGFSKHNLPQCITIGDTENNEVQVARSLARVVGAKHFYVPRSNSHYSEIFTKAVHVGGGMYSFQHGHFFDLKLPKTDLILHGHGFDYFFQGMYLPTTRKTFLGRPTRSYALQPIEPDLVGQYIQQAKYRVEGINFFTLLRKEHVARATDRLRADLDSVLSTVADLTTDPYDKWDYLTTNAPGRHYTYLNLLSAGSLSEQRTIAFSNDILDLYCSTPTTIRQGTMLLAETIKNLNPRLLEIRNANTNMRPDLSPKRLTLESWKRGVKRRLGLNISHSTDPSAKDRSWPSSADIVRTLLDEPTTISNVPISDALNSLELFDGSKIKSLTTDALQGNQKSASALLSILTIEKFLST
ncbi:MAG: asparagine synthase-related protein [Chloroflexota bacterium]|nr:asparagine synthase-related protein [Chloroflexota bacterium]